MQNLQNTQQSTPKGDINNNITNNITKYCYEEEIGNFNRNTSHYICVEKVIAMIFNYIN
jgi:hypothetical protein